MQTQPNPAHRRIALGSLFFYILLGLIIFIFIGSSILLGNLVFQTGRIYPGISVAGIPIGGLKKNQSIEILVENFSYTQNGKLLFTHNGHSWIATPGELGLYFDPETTVSNAYAIGRSGNLFNRLNDRFRARIYGFHASPSLIFDQRTAVNYLTEVSKQIIDVPTIEPTIFIESGKVVTTAGQTGKSLDHHDALMKLTSQFERYQDGTIELISQDMPPMVQGVDAAAQIATAILSEPLTISIAPDQQGDPRAWAIDQATLAEMIYFQLSNTSPPNIQTAINEQFLKQYLYDLENDVNVSASSTRFIFNDDTRQLEVIQPAIIGRDLNVDLTSSIIQADLLNGNHLVQLEFDYTSPEITDDFNGTQLGITELVNSEISYYYGSSPERVQNITTAAKQFHGLLIPPGETFSMVDALGDISLDNGYAEALIIYGDETIKGVGGGVCQVSTTLFRTAFFTGLPIVERHAHAYRVYYYEKIAGNSIDPNLAGLDATVYAPYVDLKFINDSPYWLLMETYVNPSYSSLVWKFYSTKDGRTVDWETSGLQNIDKAPKPLYRENVELAKGEVKQVDWEADGADVTVNRRVYKDGKILHQDTFITNYEAWQAIYEYGPGTEGMPPEDDTNEVEE